MGISIMIAAHSFARANAPEWLLGLLSILHVVIGIAMIILVILQFKTMKGPKNGKGPTLSP